MQSLYPHPSVKKDAPPDPAEEVARLEPLLEERRGELSALQEEFRRFKARYTQVVGSRLADLAEVEQAVRDAEQHRLGLEAAEVEEEEGVSGGRARAASSSKSKLTLRNLFWSVARMFHPDHATDEEEARHRHSIMAEASRAYREGDVESLHTLLGDEQLQFFCASAAARDEPEDLASRLLNLKEELRTVEFGLKRIRQDGLYRLMLKTDEEARHGRDALAEMAASINRQITKARHRLAHLS